MSYVSSSIIPLQFVRGSEFNSRWELNLDNVAQNVCMDFTSKKKKLRDWQ